MSRTMIDTMLWHIQREIMLRHGVADSDRDMAPLNWYISTGRACAEFLERLIMARPVLVARDLHKGGSYEDAINRICKRIGFARS